MCQRLSKLSVIELREGVPLGVMILFGVAPSREERDDAARTGEGEAYEARSCERYGDAEAFEFGVFASSLVMAADRDFLQLTAQ